MTKTVLPRQFYGLYAYDEKQFFESLSHYIQRGCASANRVFIGQRLDKTHRNPLRVSVSRPSVEPLRSIRNTNSGKLLFTIEIIRRFVTFSIANRRERWANYRFSFAYMAILSAMITPGQISGILEMIDFPKKLFFQFLGDRVLGDLALDAALGLTIFI